MDNLEDILEFVDSVQHQGGELRKSHVKATVRHLKSGKAVAVKEHEDKRPVRELSAKEKAGWLKHKQESSVNPKYHEGTSQNVKKIPHEKDLPQGYEGPFHGTDGDGNPRIGYKVTFAHYHGAPNAGPRRWSLKEHPEDNVRRSIKEMEETKADLAAGRITPRRVLGRGATSVKQAREWIDQRLAEHKADLAEVLAKKIPRYTGQPEAANVVTAKKTPVKRISKEGADHLFGKDKKLNKSLIHTFKRLLSSGKQVMVQEHTDSRQPRGDFASTSTLASLGDAARERSASVKPFVSFKEQLKTVPLDRLHILRDKMNRLSHNGLMREHQGRPILHWMAAIDAEMGRREREATSPRASVAGGELGSGNKSARSFAGLTGMSGTPRQISLAKSHVSASIRHTASGKTVIIKEHNRENSGAFYHKETGKRFEYQPTTHAWNKEQGATHEIEVRDGKRGAIVSKTVAHVIIDEDDHGNAVWERWPLKDHHVYTKK